MKKTLLIIAVIAILAITSVLAVPNPAVAWCVEYNPYASGHLNAWQLVMVTGWQQQAIVIATNLQTKLQSLGQAGRYATTGFFIPGGCIFY